MTNSTDQKMKQEIFRRYYNGRTKSMVKSRRGKRLRLLSTALCITLLATMYPKALGTLPTLAIETWGEYDTLSVSRFVGLPDEVQERTVPVGTDRSEMELPDTLEAYVSVETEAGTEDDAKPGEEDEDDDGGTTGEGDGNDDGETSEGGDSNGSGEGDDNEETSGGEGDDESSAGESNEDAWDTDVPEESDSADNRKTAGFHVQTGFFVMPVYASENTEDAQPVETLTAAAPADSVDTTDAPADGTNTNAVQENRVVIEGVTWESDPAYDKDTKGVYTFTPVLPEGYTLLDGVSLPRITVTVGDSIDAVIQALLDRIAALPDAQEYMEREPDIDGWEEEEGAYGEDYEEWMEKLYDYAEEALVIQEEIEELTEEEQALIPQEALEKLAAWAEIAEQVAGNSMVMAAAGTHTCNGITFQPWTKTDSLPQEGYYYLTENVEMGEQTQSIISAGKILNHCLNGKTITGLEKKACVSPCL